MADAIRPMRGLLMAAMLAGGAVTGCAAHFDPPAKGDHDAPKYRSDLLKCQKQVTIPASRLANATVGSSIRNMFNSEEPQRRAITACMQDKGYIVE